MSWFGFVVGVLVSSPALAGNGFCYDQNYGGVANYNAIRTLFISEDSLSESLPSSWDWRSKDGLNWLTPVRSQSCGDCVIQGFASAFEAQIKISSGFSWINPLISTNEAFHCGGGDCRVGWEPEQAIERAKTIGVLDESCGRPVAAKNDCGQKECSTQSLRRVKLQEAIPVTSGTQDVQAIKKALMRGPVYTMMAGYKDFGCYQWGVYRRNESAPYFAGHMLTIIGYNDSKKAWIIKNSWSEKWGEQGFGQIYYYDTSGVGARSWSLVVAEAQGFVVFKNLKQDQVLHGVASIAIESTRSETTLIEIRIFKKSGEMVKKLECGGQSCTTELATTDLEDGPYDIQAAALTSDRREITQSLSQPFSILNNSAQMKIRSLARISTVLSRWRDFHFQVDSQPVRPSELIFEVTKNGRVVQSQKTEVVPARLHVRWDSASVPNGSYLVRVRARVGQQEIPNLFSESVTVRN